MLSIAVTVNLEARAGYAHRQLPTSMAPSVSQIELVNNYLRFICIATFAYDWALTLADELRYVTLFQMALMAAEFTNLPLSVSDVSTAGAHARTTSIKPRSSLIILSRLSTALVAVIVGIVQVLLQMRIYIVYNRSRKILWSNIVLFIVEAAVTSCLFVKTSSKVKALLFETYLLILMLRKSWTTREVQAALGDAEGRPRSIMDVLVHGSALYFILAASGMALSIISFFVAPRYSLWTDLYVDYTLFGKHVHGHRQSLRLNRMHRWNTTHNLHE
ncbi:hypothetical protein AURDEDRAFT_160345 [Auricularia subglabra TFB-10046 SS5]|nr:hypothetical protein AURDEDRAFT_160345 [Auricularia subglabra TFB-10046 SS5]